MKMSTRAAPADAISASSGFWRARGFWRGEGFRFLKGLAPQGLQACAA